MKKIIYTLSFLALFAVAGKAQNATPIQEAGKSEVMPPSTKQQAATAQQAPKKKTDESTTAKEKPKSSGTRMAINEKGVPATKAAKDKKEEKTADPGQPATEKK